MHYSSKRLLLGVDVGGTKVAAGLISSSGKILSAVRVPMIARGSAKEGLSAVFSAVDEAMRDPRARKLTGLGVSVPGWIDFHRGTVVTAANLPCWTNYPLALRIAAHYRIPTRIANDADAAALAEATWGAGAKSKNIFYVSLGTGIGTGMVGNRQICLGRNGSAFEGGHMTIDFEGPLCPCGKRGCIEMYASGTAIARIARKRLTEPDGKTSQILSLTDGQLAKVTSEIVNKAARAGDKLARQILQDAADRLAIWLGNIIDLLEPEIIILGGGLARVMISLLPRIRRQLDHWSINPRHREVSIVEAHYGAESALVGAAALSLSSQ